MEHHAMKEPTEALPPEWQVLPLCCKARPTEAERQRISGLIHGPMDWDALLRQIRRHRVCPIVYQNLKDTDCGRINAPFWAALMAMHRRSQLQALRNHAEILRLIQRFEAQHIQVLSFKGSVLSQMLYGDIATRMSRDLDLLVSPAALEKADEILHADGYIRQEIPENPTAKQRAILLKYYHHIGYGNAAKKVLVELHWCLPAASYRFTFDELWRQRTQIRLHGRTLYTLNAEEDLLMLVLHGARHAWFRLKWLCDIQVILQTDGLQWAHIFQRARACGIEHMLVQTLILSHRFFDTELHADLFTPKVLRRASRLARLAMVYIRSAEEPKQTGHPWYLRNKKYETVLNNGWTGNLLQLKILLHPTFVDFQQWALDDRFFALYYVLRPFLVIGRKFRIGRKQDETP